MTSTLNAWYFNPKESYGAQAEQTPMLSGAYTCSVVQWMSQRVSGKQIPIHLRLSLERGNCLMSPVPGTQESLGTKFLHQSLKEVSLIPILSPKVPGISAG